MLYTATISRENAVEVADAVNDGFERGIFTTVNGYPLKSRFGSPVAKSWQNGSISVTVQARTTRGTRDVFVKVDAQLSAS